MWRHIHLALLAAWAVLIPVAFAMGWLESVVFVSAASIYANMAAHWSAWQGARAEESNGGSSDAS